MWKRLRRNGLKEIVVALGGAVLLLSAGQALAQNINSISSQIDFDKPEIFDRDEADATREDPEIFAGLITEDKEGPTFSLLLIGQTSAELDTNPGRIDGGLEDELRVRSEAIAIAKLSWTDFSLSTTALLRNDDFTGGGEYDLTVVLFENRATLNASSLDPYITYTPIFVYGDFLSNYLLTAHEVGGGITVPLVEKDGAIFGFEANYTYRFATIPELEGHRPFAKLSYSYSVSERSKLKWEGSVRPRFFTGGTSDGRNDMNLHTKASFVVALSPAVQLQMNAEYEYNDSNRVDASYSVWDIGPKLVLVKAL